jgi:TRAP-type uncharacterized transport system substrate-binding protein
MKHRNSQVADDGGPRPAPPAKLRRLAPILELGFVSAACLGLAVFLALMVRRNPAPLTLTSTMTSRMRHLAAQTAEAAEKRGLAVRRTTGSHTLDKVLELVNTREVEMGLIPGGYNAAHFPNVRQVAALDVVPLHLLVKQELFADVARSLTALKGKRISLNKQGGAAQALALEVLRFAKLRVPADGGPGDFLPLPLNDEDLLTQAERVEQSHGPEAEQLIGALPDAIFTLSPLPSAGAQKLVRLARYRLVSLPFSDAFIADRDAVANEGEAASVTDVIPCQIPSFLYDTDPPVPAQPCQTLGVRMLLVAHRDTDAHAVAQLLELIHDPPLVGLLKPAPPDQQGREFEDHAGFIQYQQRNRPVLTSQSLAHLGAILGGVGAFTGGMVAFYGFLRIRQARRFEQYFHEIRKIELIASGVETDPDVPEGAAERLRYLEAKLNDLKCRAVMDFADGGLKGEGLMQGIVALINDTRNSLAHDLRSTDGLIANELPRQPVSPPTGADR